MEDELTPLSQSIVISMYPHGIGKLEIFDLLSENISIQEEYKFIGKMMAKGYDINDLQRLVSIVHSGKNVLFNINEKTFQIVKRKNEMPKSDKIIFEMLEYAQVNDGGTSQDMAQWIYDRQNLARRRW